MKDLNAKVHNGSLTVGGKTHDFQGYGDPKST